MPRRLNERRRAVALLALIVVPCLLQTVLVGRLSVRGIGPDLALCSIAVWSMLEGGIEALVVAFVSGLLLDVLAGNPLGASALALVVAASLGIGFAVVLPRTNPIVHVALVVVATAVYYTVLMLLVDSLQAHVSWTSLAVAVIAPTAAVNAPFALIASEILRRLSAQLGGPHVQMGHP
jgi:rod shape-determining protein MreD